MARPGSGIDAEQANMQAIPCKYGHVGHWTKNGGNRNGVPSRYCLECKRIKMRKYNYGLSQDDYVAMLEKQEYRCAICNRMERLVVDHDHETGAVRGLLCNICNLGLGLVETRGFMEEVTSYLERSRLP